MSKWLLLALAGICLAATPAHGGVRQSGKPTVSLPAARPSLPRQSDDRAQRDDRPSPESSRKLREAPLPVLPEQREGVCAATSICETY